MEPMIKASILQKAVEEYARYEAKKEEEKAMSKLQIMLEEIAQALKIKGLTQLRGDNYELNLT